MTSKAMSMHAGDVVEPDNPHQLGAGGGRRAVRMKSFQSCFPGGSKKSAQIDEELRRDRKARRRQIKILLLGAGESGKSTILKQMRIIYSEGFHLPERKEIRQIIFGNMVLAFKIIIEEMKDMGLAYQLAGSTAHEASISKAPLSASIPLPLHIKEAMKGLWSDPAVQQCMKRGNEYALHDNLQYYFGRIDHLFTPSYIPDDQDILHSRLRTTGINETIFKLGKLSYHMFDVGGQRSERRKWIHCFEGVHCVMFVAALSGYDQCLVEDKTENQMHEALHLFGEILRMKWFKHSSIILFLNKIDLLEEKLKETPVAKYFPEYDGPEHDRDAATAFFDAKFRKLVRDSREIYTHFTNATDTNLLKITMNNVQDTLLQRNLQTFLI